MKKLLGTLFLLMISFNASSQEENNQNNLPLTLDDMGIYVIDGIVALSVLKACDVDMTKLSNYWNPTEGQIRIIDKKLNKQMEEKGIEFNPVDIHKQYIAAATAEGEEFVFAFVYPSQKKSVFYELENTSIICNREDKLGFRAMFNLQNFQFTFLDPVVIKKKKIEDAKKPEFRL